MWCYLKVSTLMKLNQTNVLMIDEYVDFTAFPLSSFKYLPCAYLKAEKYKDSAYLSWPQRETSLRHNFKIKLITSTELFFKIF